MHCPFCNAANPCEHHLVSIDLTFREILGGPLSEWLSARLAELYEREESNEDFCVSDSLEDILYDVSVASDGEREEDFEGAPGMSSSIRHFYCSTDARVAVAVATLDAKTRDSR